jgi:hypothetical protein
MNSFGGAIEETTSESPDEANAEIADPSYFDAPQASMQSRT